MPPAKQSAINKALKKTIKLPNRGERLAMFNYYLVTDIDNEYVHVTDEAGAGLRISHSIVEDACVSTTQFTKTEKVNRTRLAQIIEGVGHLPFCVHFRKQVVPNTVADGLVGADLSTQAKRRQVVKALMEGEQRTMHCRLHRSTEDDVEMELGRYKVIDLEKSTPGAPAQRLVDTRTIEWLVVDGVKYTV